MRSLWVATGAVVIAVSLSAVYGSWLYVRSAARETFENDILKVKQSFYEGVKAADSAVQSLESFVEATGDGDQPRFGRFSSDLMSKLPFVVGSTYYRRVEDYGRSAYEDSLKTRGLGEGIVETDSASQVVAAAKRPEFFVVDAVDEAAKDQSYFGWDALSDAAKALALESAVAESAPRATSTFLLESGNVAFEIFAPVRAEGGGLRGVIGMTVDLTKLLGEQRWREGVTVVMTTVLGGDSATKDIYRSLDLEPAKWPGLGSLSSGLDVERFGQKLGLKFEKQLFPGRVNLTIVALSAAGAALLAVLAFYLLLTYGRLQVSLNGLAEANATLEQKVAARTKDLAVAHAEIKEILDNLDEVVLAVGPDLKIGPVFSPASKRLLGRDDLTGLNLIESLFKDLDRHDEEASRHLFALELLPTFDDFQWSISSGDLLKVSHFHIEGGPRRIFSLRYSPIFEADVLKKLIVVASDVTEIVSLKESLAAREKEASTKDAVLGELARAEKAPLRGFFKEADDHMQVVAAFAASPKRGEVLPALRSLHTVKGGSRSVGLKLLAKRVHEVEDDLEPIRISVAGLAAAEEVDLGSTIAASALADLCEVYAEYRRVFGELFEASHEPVSALLGRIVPFLRATQNDRNDLINWYEVASRQGIASVGEIVSGFRAPITELAEELGKGAVLEIPTWDLYLDPALKGAMTEAFTHALRNAVDHGIEGPAEREQSGKPAVGRIWLERQTVGEETVLVVADDGRGVILRRVYEIAKQKSLVATPFEAMSPEDILDLLFLPGFSTKTEITDVSGRGIGLDAVRSSLKLQGVSCSIQSTAGQGSRFEFRLPNRAIKFMATENALLQRIA